MADSLEFETMKISRNFAIMGTFSAALVTAAVGVLVADGTRFSDFVPLTSSAGPTADESQPIKFGNPAFEQRSVADRATQLALGAPNTGAWDMITSNETGPHKGRYLFTVFETGQSGVQRTDLVSGITDTIWHAPVGGNVLGNAASFDPSFWTPWGTMITGEESWCDNVNGCTSSRYGRLFELKNPLDAPPISNPLTANSNLNADFVHRNAIPRVSHEGMAFDRDGNMYFVDELNGGNIYRFHSTANWGEIKAGRGEFFEAGQSSVLRVGDGNTFGATGAFVWVPFTDESGAALPGALTITDPNGVTSVDGRNTTNKPAFKGTDFNRPEDLQIQSVGDSEYLYFAPTDTHQVYRIDLQKNTISVFVNRNTIDLATGLPVGSALSNPDNLAIDHDGNIYIVEDRGGATDDDIWFAKDINGDGDLLDPGEGIGRWASNGTVGSEFSGLYFDTTDKRRAWVNIQHPASGNDRTIEITIPKN
jgi:uncharacterized protein